MRQGQLVSATIPTIRRFRQVYRRPRASYVASSGLLTQPSSILMTDPKSMAAWGQRIDARQEVRLRWNRPGNYPMTISLDYGPG